MSVSEKPLADECSLCGLPMYHFEIDIADEPTNGEYRWAHEVCYTFSNAVERHHEKEVQNPSDEPRADGGQVGQSTETNDRPTCDRCGEKIEDGNFIPLDAVVHPNVEVCADCVEPGDEVVDV